MKYVIYNVAPNEQIVYCVDTARKVESILNGQLSRPYYDFLLAAQEVPKISITENTTKYVLKKLGKDYVPCQTSADLDKQVQDKTEELFNCAKTDEEIEKYLNYNFAILDKAFHETVTVPLMVLSDQDDCENLPQHFEYKRLGNRSCYYDKRISQQKLESLFNDTQTQIEVGMSAV